MPTRGGEVPGFLLRPFGSLSNNVFANDAQYQVHGVFGGGLFTFVQYLFHASKWGIGVDGDRILRVDKPNPLGHLVPDFFVVKFSQYWSDAPLERHALALFTVIDFSRIQWIKGIPQLTVLLQYFFRCSDDVDSPTRL